MITNSINANRAQNKRFRILVQKNQATFLAQIIKIKYAMHKKLKYSIA